MYIILYFSFVFIIPSDERKICSNKGKMRQCEELLIIRLDLNSIAGMFRPFQLFIRYKIKRYKLGNLLYI